MDNTKTIITGILGEICELSYDDHDIYAIHWDGDQIKGITILASEPRELVIVHIVGSINPQDVRKLSGQFGIPDIEVDEPDEKEN